MTITLGICMLSGLIIGLCLYIWGDEWFLHAKWAAAAFTMGALCCAIILGTTGQMGAFFDWLFGLWR